jgi:hypothetical protein
VTVNGVDVYFHRLTGGMDGIGFSPGLARVHRAAR